MWCGYDYCMADFAGAGAPSLQGHLRPGSRATLRCLRWQALSLGLIAGLLACPSAVHAKPPTLNVDGMTFISSKQNDNEVVLHASHARLKTKKALVFLEEVHMVVEPSDYSGSFEIYCDEGQLDMETNDFEATGNVRGTTDGGRTFTAPWVHYDHEQGLLFTNAAVLINEDAITYRGGGFQYYVRSKRFRLLGGASVVQEP
jgi:LPS export ABC transporter protein LptC